eukprot:TRINITY_DN14951_c0_g2_i1.p1 TRINITY_DN14951_c0_g2~~TRINITY_DN14951_c0_g2_i1.p1  ORF type:complete len:163 (+),score=27.06 TRINITY_DN14951_c0_g2_i1:40-528(+)
MLAGRSAVRCARRQVGYPASWQPANINMGDRYNQPVTNTAPLQWKVAKDYDPEPSALRQSKAGKKTDLDFNFPDFDLTLEIHSVLHPTTLVVFRASPKLSESEIELYLQNVYKIDTIKEINLQYRRGERFMDGFGRRWKHPDFMRVYVYLERPVEIKINAKE